MSITNCKLCGQVLINVRSAYCQPCDAVMLNHRRSVRDYLRSNPNSTMWDIHTKLSIPLTIVQQLTREDFPPDDGSSGRKQGG